MPPPRRVLIALFRKYAIIILSLTALSLILPAVISEYTTTQSFGRSLDSPEASPLTYSPSMFSTPPYST